MNPIELYQSFYCIYRERNLTKAGKLLGLSQPALSLHLQSLERHRKEVLFLRTSRDLIPTDAAKRLYVQIAGPIEELERMEGQIHPKEKPKKLRIGSAKEWFQEKILPNLSKTGLSFHVQYGYPSNLLDALSNREIDLAISNQKLNFPGISFEELYTETFVFVASEKISLDPNFPFRGNLKPKPELMKQWMEEQHWFVYSEDFAIVRRFWKVNFDSRPQLKTYSVLPNLHDIKTALQMGWGVSILPSYLLGKKASLYTNERECKGFQNQLYLAYRVGERPSLEDQIQRLMDWVKT
ncbi:transcriptional regulator, LysR family [Leptospira wolbachii serovar Codice str. CDC]|uniref:Transcriptional regulator, LysR family n=1 Tax=Leptospira wolbachii serovar Codice str. CDC TaxID=1218599 RepID=R9A3E2_9LEPT|nr:LysR family transcriptional regulator [Leptospira wolbachii]EOQ96726.1 transcriptional regulator, LysR family [Leptospira wolbachii serovar Codice str. CDC]